MVFQCSVSCGGGDQYRQVQCVDDTQKHPADGCEPEGQPLMSRRCNAHLCPQAQHRQKIGKLAPQQLVVDITQRGSQRELDST